MQRCVGRRSPAVVCRQQRRRRAVERWQEGLPAAVPAAVPLPGHRRVRLAGVQAQASAAEEVATATTSTAELESEALETFEEEEDVEEELGQDASSSGCPFSAFVDRASELTGLSIAEAANAPLDGVITPGPPPLGLESALDVSQIVLRGIHEAMLAYFAKYGPVCRFANPVDLNGAAGWLMVNGPEDVQHVCAGNVRNYQHRYLPDIYKWVTKEKGILGSQGDYNKRHRRLCQPTFRRPDLLASFSVSIVARSGKMAGVLCSGGDWVETDVALQMQRLSLDIVGEVAFSHDFGQVEQLRREVQGDGGSSRGRQGAGEDVLLDAVNVFGEVMSEVFVTPMPLLRLMDAVGLPQLKALNGSLDVIRSTMLDIVAQRREKLAADPQASETADLLGQLMTAEDEHGVGATDEELWHDIHDILGAGHETTATTAAAAIYCISAHPEVEERVVAELAALGQRPPQHGDVPRLPYLTQVVKEALRMYPPIPLFPRLAREADVLPSGHAVQAGDVVFMSSYTLGRDPALWPDPLVFNPDRFTAEAEAQRHPCCWLPFGSGPRMCLGSSFALMSVTLMVGTLLQRTRFVPLSPTSKLLPVDYDITMNFNPTKGLRMAAAPRRQPS